jgi:6-phosphogluconolactonase (cycloisomerase 2 family)
MKTLGLVVLGLVLLIGLFPVVSVDASSATPMQAPAVSDGVSQVHAAEDSRFDFVGIAPTLRRPTPEPSSPVLSNAPAPPQLSIADEIPGTFGVPVTVPVVYWGYGFPIAVLAFSLDYDESCLSFDATDSDLDGIPDSISAYTPTDVGLVSVLFDAADTDGEIDIVVADISEPIGTLGNGKLLEIQMTPTCNPGSGQGIAVQISFSTSPVAAFLDSEGQERSGETYSGSVLLGTPGATTTPVATPTPTSTPTSTTTANSNPHLTFVETYRDGLDGVDGLDGATSLIVSPDGNHVYVASSFDQMVAVFSRNTTTGALIFVEARGEGDLSAASSVTLSPDGDHLYAAASNDDAITVFSRNLTTGALTFVGVSRRGEDGVEGLDGPRSVTVSPDGSHVYAASIFDDSLTVFNRNTTTGALTFVEIHRDDVGGVDGLDGAITVIVTQDGRNLYVTGFLDDAIAVFSRNSTTGTLTFVEVQRDNVGGVDGLDSAHSATMSPDGRYLYATGPGEDSLAVFSRNLTTGALSFVGAVQDGVGGVDGLEGPIPVVVGPDGSHLYALGVNGNEMAVFNRNTTTGALTFVEVHRDGVGGVSGLDHTESVTISPDGQHLYVASILDSVAVFTVEQTIDGTSVPAAAQAPTPIPSLTWWGLMAMAGVLAGLYLWRLRRKPFLRRVS